MRHPSLALSLSLVASSLILGVAAQSAHALSYVMPTDAELLRSSDGVLTAQIVDELSPTTVGGIPHRRFRLAIENALAGTPLHGSAVLRYPGMTPRDGAGMHIPGVPELTVGDRVLVFHADVGNNELAANELSLGVFFETRAANGKRVYVRALEGAEDHGKRDRSEYAWARDADAFEAWLANASSRKAGKPNYWATGYDALPVRAAKFNLSNFNGIPRRWFEFDAGQAVNWRAVAGGPPDATQFNYTSAMTTALAAWDSMSPWRVILRYTGDVLVGDRDNGNTVVWDDPANFFGTPYSCQGGMLAATTIRFLSSTTAFDGTRYHRIGAGEPYGAQIITRKNIGCHFNLPVGAAGADGVEVLAHEFGHSLGLGHACSFTSNDPDGAPSCAGNPGQNSALMRASVHRLGRGATLGADDALAMKRLYPSPTYVHPQERQIAGVSRSLTGCTGTGSRDATSSADGSVIVFQTTCTGGVKANAGRESIMVLDRKRCAAQLHTKAGDARCNQKNWMQFTKAESVADGIEPSISANGGFAVFVALAGSIPTKSLPSDTRIASGEKGSAWAVYMRNLVSNANFQVGAAMPNGVGTQPQISPDGQSITFVSSSLPENAVGDLPDATPDVFQIKPVFGGFDPIGFGAPVCASCKEVAGQGLPAGPAATNSNGGVVSYNLGNTLWLTNMVTGTSGVMVPGTSGTSTTPSMDYSGNNIVFQTTAPLDEDGSDDNGKPDVYLFEACCNKFTRISKPDVNGGVAEQESVQPVISGDGSSIAFVSTSQDLMGFTPENNSNENVYIYDTGQQIRRRYSRGVGGGQSNGHSSRPSLSYAGNMILFDSAATNLDGGDGNGVQDVFQRANPLAEFVVFGSGFD